MTSIKKLEIDENLTENALVELLEALVELGNSGSPVVTQLNQPIALFAQLVNLIIAQRNFQASAKTIETADQTTQTIINLR